MEFCLVAVSEPSNTKKKKLPPHAGTTVLHKYTVFRYLSENIVCAALKCFRLLHSPYTAEIPRLCISKSRPNVVRIIKTQDTLEINLFYLNLKRNVCLQSVIVILT